MSQDDMKTVAEALAAPLAGTVGVGTQLVKDLWGTTGTVSLSQAHDAVDLPWFVDGGVYQWCGDAIDRAISQSYDGRSSCPSLTSRVPDAGTVAGALVYVPPEGPVAGVGAEAFQTQLWDALKSKLSWTPAVKGIISAKCFSIVRWDAAAKAAAANPKETAAKQAAAAAAPAFNETNAYPWRRPRRPLTSPTFVELAEQKPVFFLGFVITMLTTLCSCWSARHDIFSMPKPLLVCCAVFLTLPILLRYMPLTAFPVGLFVSVTSASLSCCPEFAARAVGRLIGTVQAVSEEHDVSLGDRGCC